MGSADRPAVRLSGLVKEFGRTRAVDGVELLVPAGSFFGIVGPNGAGKTTTLSMATGLLRPDAGRVEVDGIAVWANREAGLEVHRRTGVLPEEPRLFDRLTGRALLQFTGELRRMPVELVRARTEELLDVLDLDEAARTRVVDFSQGMKKKIGLAAALLHGPRILFLDEPFESVDPISARTIRDVLDQHIRGGGTVVFSSHVMELVERLCDTVAVFARGRVVAAGPLREVRGGASLDEAFADLVGTERRVGEGLSWLASSSG